MAYHDFGIIENIDKHKDYSEYEPDKYNSVAVDDEIIEPLMVQFSGIKTYYHQLSQPNFGLAYCGVTIIPPESLGEFKRIFMKANEKVGNHELNQLLDKITTAIDKEKYMIHYGL